MDVPASRTLFIRIFWTLVVIKEQLLFSKFITARVSILKKNRGLIGKAVKVGRQKE